MSRAIDIDKALEGLPVLEGRSETTEAEANEAFARLAAFGDGALFAGRFSGESPWERHPNGDELVQVLKGAATLTLLTEAGPEPIELRAGMVAVVPKGTWHRFHAPGAVTLLTATPLPTEHSFAADPCAE